MAEEQDNQKQESFDELYQEFQDKFSIDKLKEMTLETYTNDTDENGFTYWILYKFGTSHEQNYKGRERINFGIYKYRNKQELSAKIDNKDDEFAWKTKKFKISNNATAKEAFKKILEYICEVAKNANEFALKDELSFLKKINNNPLPNQLKWKIAFLYSKKKLIGCYSQDKLIELLKNWLAKTPRTISDLQYQLVQIREKNPEEFNAAFASLWGKNNNNEDKTMTDTNNNASVLAKNLAKLLKNTKNIILHGAPGTGKTYLAKDIAAYMNFDKLHSKLNDEEEKKFSEHTCFVQFHPSYDYTDFVEGIRPTPDGKFKPENGIFKKFCEKAILSNISYNHTVDTQKTQNNKNSNQTRDYYRRYSDLLEYLLWLKAQVRGGKILANNDLEKFENELRRFKNKVMKYCPELADSSQASTLVVELNNFLQNFDLNNNFPTIRIEIIQDMSSKLYNFLKTNNPKNDLYTFWPLLISDLYDSPKNPKYEFKINPVIRKTRGRYFSLTEINSSTETKFTDLEKFYQGKMKSKTGEICSDIINYLKENYGLKDYNENETPIESETKTPAYAEKKNPFIFIIDEINRGELSKIFGELFFSIDPGYRGKEGAILTQYANMADKPNKFDGALGIKEEKENKGNYGHFFVPENVYIIGTMNDIDRSVESMDLAMRRRFTFKEITAESTQENILAQLDDSIRIAAQNRMNNLNNAIWDDNKKTGKLSSSNYHIGAAYFTKLKDLNNNFDLLWQYNLEPLLREYLRGQGDVQSKLDMLRQAYNKDKSPEQSDN